MILVNVRYKQCTHYIGRGTGPSGLDTGLGNPAKMFGTHPNDRAKCVLAFEAFARSNPAMMDKIRALPEDAVLGCWCAPLLCHGNVIMKIWRELHG